MLEKRVYEFITKYNLIENCDKVILGVSGGPDSICMLDILHKIAEQKLIDFEIIVCHVNHGLRDNAVLDEEFVKDFCEKIGVQFFVKHADIKKEAEIQKRGLEETGRIVRYDFFEEIALKTNSNKIAIAHNSNDRAETIIMNILRGTGPAGLIGIEAQNGKYIRPLIDTKREEIEEYLERQKITARHDESNDENIYTRNKIRNIVLPFIEKEFNPNIVDTIERLSDIIKEQEQYLESQTEKYYKEICVQELNLTNDFDINQKMQAEIVLDLKKFNSLEKVMQKRVILYSVKKIFGSTKGIEKIHIEDIIKLCNNNIGNKYLTPNKNLKVEIKEKKIRILVK